MGRFKNWLIKKLGGITKDDYWNIVKGGNIYIPMRAKLKEVSISKEFSSRADYNTDYVKYELAFPLAKELVKHLKIESEVNEILKTKRFTYKIQFLEQVKDDEETTNN